MNKQKEALDVLPKAMTMIKSNILELLNDIEKTGKVAFVAGDINKLIALTALHTDIEDAFSLYEQMLLNK